MLMLQMGTGTVLTPFTDASIIISQYDLKLM